jgi:REP-associated tyrosine transposase
VLNPLRADMVKKLEDWPWSSYLATINAVSAPEWLDVDWLLGQFSKQRKQAIRAYSRFVMEGKGLPSPLDQTRHLLLLGDDNFIGQYKQNKKPEALREISRAHRRILALSLDEYKQSHPNRNEAMVRAYLSGAYSMAEIGEYFGVHYMTVSRAVRKFEGDS